MPRNPKSRSPPEPSAAAVVGADRRAAIAKAAMAAIEPLVELLLELGMTSPEAESLLRSLYIHKARAWLVQRNGGQVPSDVRVALITGVHRNFVRELLSEPPQVAQGRQRRGYLAGRVLRAWHTNPAYRTDSDKPRDLPEKGEKPSFATLVAESLPGASAGPVLQELIRAGAVESLGDHRVRVRARTLRQPGLSLDNVVVFGREAKAVLATMTRKLYEPNASGYCDSTGAVRIEQKKVPLIREVVRRRAENFLSALKKSSQPKRRRRGHLARA